MFSKLNHLILDVSPVIMQEILRDLCILCKKNTHTQFETKISKTSKDNQKVVEVIDLVSTNGELGLLNLLMSGSTGW